MITRVKTSEESVNFAVTPILVLFLIIVMFVLTLALLPTLINYFYLDIVDIDISYTLLRVFSLLSFSFVLYVFTKSSYQNLLLKIMKNIFVFLIFVSLYTYLAQLFNFYEPLRNRPGTGILGYDVQSNFWISGSHRLVGTFREPVFLVSLLFPLLLPSITQFDFGQKT